MLDALGIRLVVGQQTLDLYAVVRIHHPQPETLALACGSFVLMGHGIIASQPLGAEYSISWESKPA
jgi:hypothetical protein